MAKHVRQQVGAQVCVLWAETEQISITRTGLGSLPPNKIFETSEEFRGPLRRAVVRTCGQQTALSTCQGAGPGQGAELFRMASAPIEWEGRELLSNGHKQPLHY